MAILDVDFSANNSLGKKNAMRVIVPEKRSGPFPVLYLLHGLSDNHTAWTQQTNIVRYVEWLPLIIVMPNGERGWYTDSACQEFGKYESNIIEDAIPFVNATFRTIPMRSSRGIAGLSMGGYGAVKLALKHPDLFCATVGYSGAYDVVALAEPDTDRARELKAILGNEGRQIGESIFSLAEKLNPSDAPAIHLSCGTEDGLIENSRKLHRHLDEVGLAHEYFEHPGEHDWRYWNRHILEGLNFVMQVFGMSERLDVENSV